MKPGGPGRFIAIVGPSGVGKDSLMEALVHRIPGLTRARRVITRAPEAGGEDYEPADQASFVQRAERGEFALWWQAHGLHYGIPASVRTTLSEGGDVMANLSRAKLGEAAASFEKLIVLNLTASPQTLAQRLAGRGRESLEDVAKRLERTMPAFHDGLVVHTLSNDTSLSACVDAALALLVPQPSETRP